MVGASLALFPVHHLENHVLAERDQPIVDTVSWAAAGISCAGVTRRFELTNVRLSGLVIGRGVHDSTVGMEGALWVYLNHDAEEASQLIMRKNNNVHTMCSTVACPTQPEFLGKLDCRR